MDLFFGLILCWLLLLLFGVQMNIFRIAPIMLEKTQKAIKHDVIMCKCFLRNVVNLTFNLEQLGNWGLLDNQQTLAFELRFVISGSGRRQAEGFWPAEAVMDMLKKIDAIKSVQVKAVESSS
eukprot:c18720_g1_i4 orf=1877-2242(+)